MERHEEGSFLTEGGVSEVDPRSGSFVRVAVPVPLLPLLVYRVPDGAMLPARGARLAWLSPSWPYPAEVTMPPYEMAAARGGGF